ncbi:short-chain dehydrogenase/reductase SDR [Hyaloraphidium curvatum]|nr:short-chain dehydrogenase/reductase SDR [Hyaloraphidium curvatum]
MSVEGRVALVTGASRGVGRGVALALAQAGATVFATARTLRGQSGGVPLPGSLEELVEECAAGGAKGTIVPIKCDHADDAQVRSAVAEIESRAGRLDVLVNNVWWGYEGLHLMDDRGRTWGAPFWEQPASMLDDMLGSVRAHYVATQLCTPLMLRSAAPDRPGLIVNVSYFSGALHRGTENVPYHLSKNADDRMAAAFANHLRPHHIASLSLYPGLVRTEGTLAVPAGVFDFSNSESPLFVGRAVAALAADPKVMDRSGECVVAAELGDEYGFVDVDGKRPKSIRDSFGSELKAA